MPYTFLKLKIPHDNEHSPLVMEQILSSLHSIGKKFSFEIWNFDGKISICFWTNQKKVLLQLLETHYPGIFVLETLDIAENMPPNIHTAHLKLNSCDIYPIRRYSQTTDWIQRTRTDSYLGILAPFTKVKETGGIQIIFEPSYWHKKGSDTLEIDECISTWWVFSRFWKLKSLFLKKVYHYWWLRTFFVIIAKGHKKIPAFNFNDAIDHRGHSRETSSQAARAKLSQIGFSVTIRLISHTQKNLHTMASGFSQFNIPGFNGLKMDKIFSSNTLVRNRVFFKPFVLSLEELAGILALPTKEVRIPELERTTFRAIKKNNHHDGIVVGKSLHDNPIHLSLENFTKHIAVLGKTGSGKSTYAINLLQEVIKKGDGVAIVDPHGDLIDFLSIPKTRRKDVVIIDPTDTEYPIALNVLHGTDKTKIVSAIVSTFQKLYSQSWGPRTEYLLTNVLALLVEQPVSCLLDIQKVFLDGNFRKKCLLKTDDPMIRQFWEKEFLKIPAKMRNEAISPILNKVNRFLMVPMMRNILGQNFSKIDFRKMMDEKKIVLIKLSKGKMGEDNSALLGNFILTLIQIAALSRADTHKREVFHLFIDELQHFTALASGHVSTLLSEGRKYGINLILATQHTSQLKNLEETLFGNVSTLVSFNLGHSDAQKVSLYLGEVEPSDLINLSPYHGYMKTFKNGVSEVVSFKNIEPCEFEKLDPEMLENSRVRYARKRKDVEEEIRKSFENSDIPLP